MELGTGLAPHDMYVGVMTEFGSEERASLRLECLPNLIYMAESGAVVRHFGDAMLAWVQSIATRVIERSASELSRPQFSQTSDSVRIKGWGKMEACLICVNR